ncbi:MAG: hypothetical protein EOM68_27150, partial [Spirochaetia bacterium]|nr:hypothetical protein [Spirochaetia bacterium]
MLIDAQQRGEDYRLVGVQTNLQSIVLYVCILLENRFIAQVVVDMQSAVTAVDLIRPDDMQHPKHRIIFKAICETVQQGGVPELLTVYPMIAGQVDATLFSSLADNHVSGPAHVR